MNAEHLDDKEIAALICGDAEDDATAHLKGCAACAARIEQSRALLRNLGAAAAQSAERSEAEWLRQRSRILAAARARGHRKAGWQWVLATALLLVAAIGLAGIPSRMAGPPPGATYLAPAAVDPNALLTVVAEELEQQSPDALAPAALFVERDQNSSAGARGRVSSRQGERND